MEQYMEGDWDADHRQGVEVEGRTTEGERGERQHPATKLKVRSGMAETQ